MQATWDRIFKALSVDWANLRESTNEPVSIDSWSEIEGTIGMLLPESFKEFYAVRNGESNNLQKGNPVKLIFGNRLLSQDSIIRIWNDWNEIVEESSEEELIEDFMDSKSVVPGVVKETYANKRWIPFTSDDNGNHLGIDLDPDEKGVPGQIISFGVDVELKYVLAPSFKQFMDWFAIQLESKYYVVEKYHSGDSRPSLMLKNKEEVDVFASKYFYGKA